MKGVVIGALGCQQRPMAAMGLQHEVIYLHTAEPGTAGCVACD